MLFCFQLKWLRKDLVPTAFPARKLTQSFCHWGLQNVCVCSLKSQPEQNHATSQPDPKRFPFLHFSGSNYCPPSWEDIIQRQCSDILSDTIVYKIPRVTEHHRRALEAGILQILALLPSTFHLTFFSFDIQLSFNKINPDVRSFTQYSSIFISVWME